MFRNSSAVNISQNVSEVENDYQLGMMAVNNDHIRHHETSMSHGNIGQIIPASEKTRREEDSDLIDDY